MRQFLNKSEKWIGPVLCLLFIALVSQGIAWGAPDQWHPDELIKRVLLALQGEWVFDEINFDYPSLPKHVMFWVGRLVLALGFDLTVVMLAARFTSVLLGGAVVWMAFRLARRMGAGLYTALFAAGLAFFSSELALNSRFAHNDIYVAFFVGLLSLALLRFYEHQGRGWFYLSLLLAGLASSSKYNAVGLLAAPFLVWLLVQGRAVFKDWFRTLETAFIGLVMAVAGYVIGTPKAGLWPVFYFKRVIPALQRAATFGRQPGSVVGFVGQWHKLALSLGQPVYFLVLAALVFWLVWLARGVIQGKGRLFTKDGRLAVLGLVIFFYDLPIMVSYNYQPRFFTAMVPLLAVLAALLVQEAAVFARVREWGWGRYILGAVCVFVLGFSMLRTAGVLLLFNNDSRVAASEFVLGLEPDTSVEYTLYPPTVPDEMFSSAHNYPIYFIKIPGDELPTSRFYTFNTGEEGIEERQPRYLIIDSFTYERFGNEYVCELHQVDCDFFQRLIAGESNYEMIASFEYELPAYIPLNPFSFVNPDIQVYERGK